MRTTAATENPITTMVWLKGFAVAHYLLLVSAAILAFYDKAAA